MSSPQPPARPGRRTRGPFAHAAAFAVVLIMIPFAPASRAGAPLADWTFEDPAWRPLDSYAMENLRVEEGELRGRIMDRPGGGWIIFPLVDLATPVRLEMRLKTAPEVFGRGEIYWGTADDPGFDMRKFMRFPIEHDGRRHDYSLPLPASGRLTVVRLAVGYKAGDFALEHVRLVADPLPADVVMARSELPETLTLEDAMLRLELAPRAHRYTVIDKRTDRAWTADASDAKPLLTRAERIDERRLRLRLWEHSSRSGYTCDVELTVPGRVTFALEADDPDAAFYGANFYPPPLQADFRGKLLFCDRSCGVYMDQDDPIYARRMLGIYGNTSCTDMPWVGAIDPERGDGMMLLAETPYDAYFHLLPDAEGACWPRVHWDVSMDTFRYPRRASWRFVAEGGYNALAELYRDHALADGLLVTLKQKAARKPATERLKGAPILWGGTDVWRFVREARADGLLRGVLSNAHHGLWEIDALRRLNEMGYITLEYDAFADILDGPTGFNRDNVEQTALHPRPGLGPQTGWVDDMHAYTIRSSAYGLRALKTYVPEALARYGFNGRFIDVSMAMHLHEDHHPEHTFDKRQDLAYRREVYAWLNGLGLVLGTEHGNDWGADLVEYTEGSLSGPHWWLHNDRDGWSINRLQKPRDPGDYRPEYLKFGIGYAERIPLWQLVYHDCLVTTFYWGDVPGFHFHARPELSDRMDLFTLLYGGVPLFWRDKNGYEWPENRARFMRSYHHTCPFHEEVGFSRLLSHEFLSDDAALQRTRFASGHEVVVNFDDAPRTWTTAGGEAHMLAPRGFRAIGPGFVQERLWVDGAAHTRIEKDGYVRHERPVSRQTRVADVVGTLTAFRVGEDRWQIALEAGGGYRVAPRELTGWDEPIWLLELDELGDDRRIVRRVEGEAWVSLPVSASRRHYALERRMDPARIVMYPAERWIDERQPVVLSAAEASAGLSYTLRGVGAATPPMAYEGPVLPAHSTTFTARVRIDGTEHVGRPHGYDLTRTLFASDVMTGGDPAREVDVALDGCDRLRILVGMAGDMNWSDWADLGDAAFVMGDGSRRYLSDMDWLFAKQTIHEPGRDAQANAERTPLTIAGRRFDKGLALCADAELIFAIPEGAERFAAWVGVDDRGNPPPDSVPALFGTVTFEIQGVLPPGP